MLWTFKNKSEKTIIYTGIGLFTKNDKIMYEKKTKEYLLPYSILNTNVYVGNLNLEIAGSGFSRCEYGEVPKSEIPNQQLNSNQNSSSSGDYSSSSYYKNKSHSKNKRNYNSYNQNTYSSNEKKGPKDGILFSADFKKNWGGILGITYIIIFLIISVNFGSKLLTYIYTEIFPNAKTSITIISILIYLFLSFQLFLFLANVL
jgi:hypothetical protein